jgi:hypothetical protein
MKLNSEMRGLRILPGVACCRFCKLLSFPACLCLLVLLLCTFPIGAQRIALVTPDKSEPSIAFASALADNFDPSVKVLDLSLTEAAFNSLAPATPFNLTADEAKKIGSVMGCDLFILLRTATQRRSAYRRAEYYEAYAPLFVVSSRTGRLVFWKLQQFEANKAETAAKLLRDSLPSLAAEISEKVRSFKKAETNEALPRQMEEVPDSDSPLAKSFRPPIPYRRIKPEYTVLAAMYDVVATVELRVDLDSDGTILGTEVVRWAGFGLDESVEKTVRSMNWRPAERNGKTLPMRFLLRYNFRKPERDTGK